MCEAERGRREVNNENDKLFKLIELGLSKLKTFRSLLLLEGGKAMRNSGYTASSYIHASLSNTISTSSYWDGRRETLLFILKEFDKEIHVR